MAAEDANLRNWRFGTFGDLAARVRNYASRGRESANYGGAILLGLTALEWEEGAQHPAHWRFVTLYNIVSQTGGWQSAPYLTFLNLLICPDIIAVSH